MIPTGSTKVKVHNYPTAITLNIYVQMISYSQQIHGDEMIKRKQIADIRWEGNGMFFFDQKLLPWKRT